MESKHLLRKRLVVVLAAAALAVFGIMGSPMVASALPCGSSRLCLFEDSSYMGCKLVLNGTDQTLANNDPCGFGGDGFNDDASSAKNNETITITLCKDISLTGGRSAVLSPGENDAQLENNDTASSVKYGQYGC